MKKKIQLSLFLLVCIACGTQRIDKPLVSNQERINYIIKDIENKYFNNYFEDTNVITILKLDEFEYEVYRKSFLRKLAVVVPNTSHYFINSYNQKGDKIYFYESNTNSLPPSTIFKKMSNYGIKLDSCSYLYEYQMKDPIKYQNCIKGKTGGSLLEIDRALKYNFSIDLSKNKTKIKRTKFSLE